MVSCCSVACVSACVCLRDVFAVLDEPPPNLPSAGKPKKLKKKDSEKWAAAEAAAMAASMAAATVVRIKALDGLGCSTVCTQVGGVRVVVVWWGPGNSRRVGSRGGQQRVVYGNGDGECNA